MFNYDLVDLDEKLTDLIQDFADAAEYCKQYPDSADAREDLHRAYVCVTSFVGPQPHVRLENVTEDGVRHILVYRGFDHVETIEIDPPRPWSRGLEG